MRYRVVPSLAVVTGLVLGSGLGTASGSTSPSSAPCGNSIDAVGQQVGENQLAAIQYLTPTYAVGVTRALGECGRNTRVSHRFVTTKDGGSAWVVRGSLPSSPAAAEFDVQLAFTSLDRGWVLVAGSLFATTDGGTRWRSDPVGQNPLALAISGPNVMVAATDCAPAAVLCPPGTTLRIWATVGDSGAWIGSTPAPVSMTWRPDPDLVVGGRPGQAYLLSSGPGSLVATSDGGQHWLHGQNPCTTGVRPYPGQVPTLTNQPYVGADALAVTPSGEVWIICHGQPAAGNIAAGVYVSDDGGATWTLRWAGGAFDVTPSLAVLSDRQAIWTEGYPVAVTVSGGTQWSPQLNMVDGGGPVVFSVLPPSMVWVLLVANDNGRPVLFHSSDGVHFAPVRRVTLRPTVRQLLPNLWP